MHDGYDAYILCRYLTFTEHMQTAPQLLVAGLCALLVAAPCAVHAQTQSQRLNMAAHVIGVNMAMMEVCFKVNGV
jgi:hypothetical protein